MLVVAVVVLGLLMFAFIEAYLLPQYAFTLAEQQARALASAASVSVSPPAVGTSGYSFVVYPYIPGFKGNVTVSAFVAPEYLLPSVSVLTPQSGQPEFTACYPGDLTVSSNEVIYLFTPPHYSGPIDIVTSYDNQIVLYPYGNRLKG